MMPNDEGLEFAFMQAAIRLVTEPVKQQIRIVDHEAQVFIGFLWFLRDKATAAAEDAPNPELRGTILGVASRADAVAEDVRRAMAARGFWDTAGTPRWPPPETP